MEIILNKNTYIGVRLNKEEVALFYKTLANCCKVCGHNFENDEYYYVPYLNELMCKACYDDFIKNADFKDSVSEFINLNVIITTLYIKGYSRKLCILKDFKPTLLG